MKSNDNATLPWIIHYNIIHVSFAARLYSQKYLLSLSLVCKDYFKYVSLHYGHVVLNNQSSVLDIYNHINNPYCLVKKVSRLSIFDVTPYIYYGSRDQDDDQEKQLQMRKYGYCEERGIKVNKQDKVFTEWWPQLLSDVKQINITVDNGMGNKEDIDPLNISILSHCINLKKIFVYMDGIDGDKLVLGQLMSDQINQNNVISTFNSLRKIRYYKKLTECSSVVEVLSNPHLTNITKLDIGSISLADKEFLEFLDVLENRSNSIFPHLGVFNLLISPSKLLNVEQQRFDRLFTVTLPKLKLIRKIKIHGSLYIHLPSFTQYLDLVTQPANGYQLSTLQLPINFHAQYSQPKINRKVLELLGRKRWRLLTIPGIMLKNTQNYGGIGGNFKPVALNVNSLQIDMEGCDDNIDETSADSYLINWSCIDIASSSIQHFEAITGKSTLTKGDVQVLMPLFQSNTIYSCKLLPVSLEVVESIVNNNNGSLHTLVLGASFVTKVTYEAYKIVWYIDSTYPTHKIGRFGIIHAYSTLEFYDNLVNYRLIDQTTHYVMYISK